MLRRFVNFVLILLVATVCYGHLWGADFENDALEEAEAKRDMMAYVQSTFPIALATIFTPGIMSNMNLVTIILVIANLSLTVWK
jgi:hypothetical protein